MLISLMLPDMLFIYSMACCDHLQLATISQSYSHIDSRQRDEWASEEAVGHGAGPEVGTVDIELFGGLGSEAKTGGRRSALWPSPP
jgi:hypothetical protein